VDDQTIGPTIASARLKGIRSLTTQVKDWRKEVGNPKRRVPLGWPALDDLVRGPAGGEVFTLIARSHVGKSLFATNVMANNSKAPIIFFSLEMPEAQVLQRIAAHLFNVPAKEIEEHEYRRELPDFVDELPNRIPKQVIVDQSSLSLNDMSVYVDDYNTWFGERPSMVIIDYLEEIGGGQASGEGWVRAEATASAVKAWAKDEKLGVVLLHQTNRITKNFEAPNEDSAKGSGYTQADVVLGMWRPGWDPDLDIGTRKERENYIGINVIKNRVRGIKHEGLGFRLDPALRIVPEWTHNSGPDAAAFENVLAFNRDN
jgi:replicative DNA helicase